MGMNKKEFITQLNECKVDKNMTINHMSEFGVADKFGSKHFSTEHLGMLKILRKLGANVSDVSYVDGLWFNGEAPESAVVEPKEETDRITLDVQEDVTESIPEVLEVSEPIIELVAEGYKETPEIEWDWINSLSNTKKDKAALDDWAEVTLGIKLNKRNTLPNMIADLKEQLGLEE